MYPYPAQAAGGAPLMGAQARSDCRAMQDRQVVAAYWATAARRAVVAGQAAAGGTGWQVDAASQGLVDPGRTAIHNRVVAVVPANPAGAGAVAVVLRYPNSRSVIRMSLYCRSAYHNRTILTTQHPVGGERQVFAQE